MCERVSSLPTLRSCDYADVAQIASVHLDLIKTLRLVSKFFYRALRWPVSACVLVDVFVCAWCVCVHGVRVYVRAHP